MEQLQNQNFNPSEFHLNHLLSCIDDFFDTADPAQYQATAIELLDRYLDQHLQQGQETDLKHVKHVTFLITYQVKFISEIKSRSDMYRKMIRLEE